MKIELRERTAEHVGIYWNKVQDEEIKRMLPTRVISLEEALSMFERSLLPGATSYGKVIYADEEYVGDVWCYGIDEESEQSAMLSYTIFEKRLWGRGVATEVVALFLEDIFERFNLNKVGAFTYEEHYASIKVLDKVGFKEIEAFEEAGVYSKYFEKKIEDES